MSKEFKVGDRVRCVKGWETLQGAKGTIVPPPSRFSSSNYLEFLPDDPALQDTEFDKENPDLSYPCTPDELEHLEEVQ